jgi:hypothetical protein
MTYVYAVRLHDGEQSWIGGVFSTQEKADASVPYFNAKYGDYVSVEVFQYPLDAVPVRPAAIR